MENMMRFTMENEKRMQRMSSITMAHVIVIFMGTGLQKTYCNTERIVKLSNNVVFFEKMSHHLAKITHPHIMALDLSNGNPEIPISAVLEAFTNIEFITKQAPLTQFLICAPLSIGNDYRVVQGACDLADLPNALLITEDSSVNGLAEHANGIFVGKEKQDSALQVVALTDMVAHVMQEHKVDKKTIVPLIKKYAGKRNLAWCQKAIEQDLSKPEAYVKLSLPSNVFSSNAFVNLFTEEPVHCSFDKLETNASNIPIIAQVAMQISKW